MDDISKLTFLITGASGGLGRYLAEYFGRKGARQLIVCGRREDSLIETAERVKAAGVPCRYHVADLCRPASLEAMVETINGRPERIDVLINSAADVTSKPFLETSPEEIDRIIQTNITGTLLLIRLLAPRMIANGGGMIINISSLAGYKPNPAQTVYGISKAGVNAISDGLRAELAGVGIHVMNVALSSIDLGDQQEGRGVPAERFARLLEHAIQQRRSELFLSPVTKWLMRLYRFCPALMRLTSKNR